MSVIRGTSVISVVLMAFYLHGGNTVSGNGDLVPYPKVICYFLHYTWYRDNIANFYPSNVNASLCTHIVYAFAGFDSSTLTLKSSDEWADIGNKFYEQITAYKNEGVKVLLNLGGWTESAGDKFSRLVSDPVQRLAFVDNTVLYLRQHGFQGLVLNWEYPKCWQNDCAAGPASDKENYASLIRELRTIFDSFGLELAALVPQWLNLIDEGFDIPTLNSNLDWIGVQTYYTSSPYSPVTEPDSPLYSSGSRAFSTDYSLNELVSRGADRSKLIVGFPFFARTFTLRNPRINGFGAPTTGPGLPGQYTKESGQCSYFEICSNIQKKFWRTKSSEVNNSIAHRGNQWANYLGPSDVIRRVQLIKDGGYGGALVWDLSNDDFLDLCKTGVYPLLTTLNNELYESNYLK